MYKLGYNVYKKEGANMDTNKLKDRLTEAIQRRHMKPIDLAKSTNISRGAISQYLSGKVQPKQDKIALMAQTLRVSPAWLMGFSVPMEPVPNERQLSRGAADTIMRARMHDRFLKKSTIIQFDLSLEERDLIEAYRQLPDKQRITLKMLIDAFVDPDGSIEKKRREKEIAEVNQWLNENFMREEQRGGDKS